MDDEKIIGPLNFKQFVVLAGAVAMSYLLYRGFGLISAPFILFIAYVAAKRMIGDAPRKIDEQYLRSKRAEFDDPAKYKQWLQRRVAMMAAQINERELKGFVRDPELDKTMELIATILKETLP